MRLIDAGNAKASLDWTLIGDAADAACRVIDSAPTVDAVVVTRCKDCEYLRVWNQLPKDKLCVFAISSGHKNAFLQFRRAEGDLTTIYQDDIISNAKKAESEDIKIDE